MRSVSVFMLICLILLCSNHRPTASADTAEQRSNAVKPTPLILEKNEGERREWRVVEGYVGPPMEHFILKVDPQNGSSSHLVFGTEDLEPGGKIDMHRHPGADEILFLERDSQGEPCGLFERSTRRRHRLYPGQHLDFHDQYRKRVNPLRVHLLGTWIRGIHAGGVGSRRREKYPAIKSGR